MLWRIVNFIDKFYSFSFLYFNFNIPIKLISILNMTLFSYTKFFLLDLTMVIDGMTNLIEKFKFKN
jgi:hypothetical protein